MILHPSKIFYFPIVPERPPHKPRYYPKHEKENHLGEVKTVYLYIYIYIKTQETKR